MLGRFRWKASVIAALLAVSAMLTPGVRAQTEDKKIDAAGQAQAIDSIAVELNRTYVFPDVAKKMVKLMRDQYKKKAYAPITSTREFAQKLTEDLQSVSHDRHLSVDYLTDEDLRMMSDTTGQTATAQELNQERKNNFGFREIRMLPGNVGYLRFDGFSNANEAGATAVAAMNFFANADAIIFDVRQNGGGSPKMIQLLCNYLFERPTHLNDFYIRRSDRTEQFWTQPQVTGTRLTKADVFVLTSRRTFSAAEEFTYDLKSLKRATVVGDTTGGGAHPVDGFFWPDVHLSATIPFGRAVNPITKTNWEGTGVKPDVEVSADQALKTAHLTALKKAIDRTTDAERKGDLERTMKAIESGKS